MLSRNPMSNSPDPHGPEASPTESAVLALWSKPQPQADGAAPLFSSTVIVSGRADSLERDEKLRAMIERGVVVEHCRKCGSALDISSCFPLSEIACPECGQRFKVLERFGHFLLLSVLGQGGMGCVCRAFDQRLERDVALKLVRKDRKSVV